MSAEKYAKALYERLHDIAHEVRVVADIKALDGRVNIAEHLRRAEKQIHGIANRLEIETFAPETK